jgi:hypothetical protein
MGHNLSIYGSHAGERFGFRLSQASNKFNFVWSTIKGLPDDIVNGSDVRLRFRTG